MNFDLEQFSNPETEQSLLGGLLIKPDLIITANIHKNLFFHPAHEAVADSIIQTYQRGFTVSPASVYPVLEKSGAVDQYSDIDFKSYMIELASNVVVLSTSVVEGWVNLLDDLYQRRTMAIAARDFISKLAEQKGTVNDSLQTMMGAISTSNAGIQIKTHEEVLGDIKRRLAETKPCYPTGLPMLDSVLAGGLYEGWLYGIAGAEKMGKTTFGHTISYQLTCPHMYLALEMGSSQIEEKNVAREIGVNSLAFLSKSRTGLIKNIAGITPNKNRYYVDAPGATWDELKFVLMRAKLQHGIKGFILDYWQLVGGKSRHDTEEKHIRQVAQSCADFARKEGLWCILLAQAGKDNEVFGGNGLVKACDMLLIIKKPEKTENEGARYLHMKVSRFTERRDVGDESNPAFRMDTRKGPYFYEVDAQ